MSDSATLQTLGEWDSTDLLGLSLTPEDRKQLQRWNLGDSSKVRIDELKDGVRLRTTSWVGVIRLQSLELRIMPKLPGSSGDLVRMLEAAAGLSGLRASLGAWRLDTTGYSLFDLIALLLAKASERLVRAGLLSDYVEEEDLLPVVRGRLLADRQLLNRFGRLDRLWCRHDERKENTPENQLIAAALHFAARRVREEAIRGRLHRLQAIFESLCSPEPLELERVRAQITYHRLNEHYRHAHQLAWVILQGAGARDLLTSGDTEMFAFLLNMNPLFEAFVTVFLKHALLTQGYQVRSQKSANSIIRELPGHTSYGTVRPDVLLQRGMWRLPVDAKYKRYEDVKVSTADIYQSFLYAFAFESPGLAAVRAATLIYPTTQSAKVDLLEIRSLDNRMGAEITALGLPLRAALDEWEHRTHGPVTALLREVVARYSSG